MVGYAVVIFFFWVKFSSVVHSFLDSYFGLLALSPEHGQPASNRSGSLTVTYGFMRSREEKYEEADRAWTRFKENEFFIKSNIQSHGNTYIPISHHSSLPIFQSPSNLPNIPFQSLHRNTPSTPHLIPTTPPPFPRQDLTRRPSPAGRHIEGGILLEEVPRPQQQGHGLGRHDGKVLRGGEMDDAKGVPEHDVSVDDALVRVGGNPLWEARRGVAGGLRHMAAGRVDLGVVVYDGRKGKEKVLVSRGLGGWFWVFQ